MYTKVNVEIGTIQGRLQTRQTGPKVPGAYDLSISDPHKSPIPLIANFRCLLFAVCCLLPARWCSCATMSSPFLPLSSSPDSPLRPRRPSLDPEREILSTRGQRLMNFLPTRASSLALNDMDDDLSERLFLRRGSFLIGRSNPRYEW